MRYIVGQTARVTATLKNALGAAIDPTTLKFIVRPPGAVSNTTYTYPAAVEIVKEATGIYHFDLTLTLEGTYFVAYESTNPNDSDESSLTVVSAFR